MKLLLALSVILAVASARSPRHFKSAGDGDDGKIVNGELAALGQFPFQISYQYASGFHSCGGSIYNKDWIITAAHCVDGTANDATSSNRWVVAGILNLDDTATKQRIQVDKILQHRNYYSFNFTNDIALLHLSSSLDFSDSQRVAAVNLPAKQTGNPDPTYNQGEFDSDYPQLHNPDEDDTLFGIAGWGTNSSGGTSPRDLTFTLAYYIQDDVCNEPNRTITGANAGYTGGVADSMICAGGAGGNHDSCQGDSGGPMVEATRNSDATYSTTDTLIGIVSWGRGCAQDGYPGVYTQVSYFVDWIQAAVDCSNQGGSATACD